MHVTITTSVDIKIPQHPCLHFDCWNHLLQGLMWGGTEMESLGGTVDIGIA